MATQKIKPTPLPGVCVKTPPPETRLTWIELLDLITLVQADLDFSWQLNQDPDAPEDQKVRLQREISRTEVLLLKLRKMKQEDINRRFSMGKANDRTGRA
jgi:hypothetical protein